MKNFLTLSVFASALVFSACGAESAEQAMPAPDAALDSSEMMVQSSDAAMMASSEDGTMMKVDVDAKMQASAGMMQSEAAAQ